jgi:hypothetical protein
MKTYPDSEKKNRVAEFTHWFYLDFLGKQPDSTHYASANKILSGIFTESKKYPGARVYTTNDVADLMYFLRESGVEQIEITIVKFPNLLAAFVDKETGVVDRIVKYIKENSRKSEVVAWSSPKGW